MANIPLGAILRHNAERFGGDALAITQGQESVSWRELEAEANRRARLLKAHGVRPGDIVILALANSLEFYETAFALWKLGATPGAVSPKLALRELQAMVDLARPRIVVGVKESVGEALAIPAGTDTSGYSPDQIEESVSLYWKAMPSGGSTGRPKVIVDHCPAMFDPDVPMRFQPIGGTVLNPGPLYHNAPFSASFRALVTGNRIIDMPRFDAEETLRLIEAHKVSWTTFVPTMMNRIWNLPPAVREGYDLSSLKTVWHLAAPMPKWLKERWIEWLGPERIWELYAGTERVGTAWLNGVEWLAHPGSVGRPVEGTQVRVLDDGGMDCAAGDVGDIYMRSATGPNSHYIGAEAKTVEGGWQSLGDIGWLDADGYLYLADRRVDMIIRGGANIYPAEVESALAEHPDIASSIVVGLPDEDLGQSVHAIVQRHPEGGTDLTAESLLAFLKDRLAPYKLPRSLEFVDEPLRDESGKARRSALREERIRWLQEGRNFLQMPNTPRQQRTRQISEHQKERRHEQ